MQVLAALPRGAPQASQLPRPTPAAQPHPGAAQHDVALLDGDGLGQGPDAGRHHHRHALRVGRRGRRGVDGLLERHRVVCRGQGRTNYRSLGCQQRWAGGCAAAAAAVGAAQARHRARQGAAGEPGPPTRLAVALGAKVGHADHVGVLGDGLVVGCSRSSARSAAPGQRSGAGALGMLSTPGRPLAAGRLPPLPPHPTPTCVASIAPVGQLAGRVPRLAAAPPQRGEAARLGVDDGCAGGRRAARRRRGLGRQGGAGGAGGQRGRAPAAGRG